MSSSFTLPLRLRTRVSGNISKSIHRDGNPVSSLIRRPNSYTKCVQYCSTSSASVPYPYCHYQSLIKPSKVSTSTSTSTSTSISSRHRTLTSTSTSNDAATRNQTTPTTSGSTNNVRSIRRDVGFDESLLRGFSSLLAIDIQWGWMDSFQHVNNVEYIRFCESSRIAMFQHALATLPHNHSQHSESLADAMKLFMSAKSIGPILKSISMKYRAPVVYPDTVIVGSRITSLLSDRLTMLHRIISTQRNIIVGEAEDVIVTYDYRTLKKADMPAVIYDAIQLYMEIHNRQDVIPYRPVNSQ